MDDVGIATIMTKEFATVTQDCAIPRLTTAMRESGSSFAVVCEDAVPTGVITMGDLAPVLEEALRGGDTGELTAIDVISGIERSPMNTFRAAVFNRVPWQVGHGWTLMYLASSSRTMPDSVSR